MRGKSRLALLVALFTFAVFLIHPQTAYASFWSDAVDAVRSLISQPKPAKQSALTLTADVVPQNPDATLTAGDMAVFSFEVRNPTDSEYSLAEIDTGIRSDAVTFIHDLKGATGISQNGETIRIQNVFVGPKQNIPISFTAQLAYAFDKPTDLTFTPHLISAGKTDIVTAGQLRKQIKTANKTSKDVIRQTDMKKSGGQ